MVDGDRFAHITWLPRIPILPMTNEIFSRVSVSLLAALVLIVVLRPVLSTAQDATGRITGTVTDSTGAVLPGVQVTATNTATHVSRQATSDQDGFYQVLALPPAQAAPSSQRSGQSLSVSDILRRAVQGGAA